jgi:hypothetical protein
LIQAQKIKGEYHRQECRFRRKKRLHAKSVRVQLRFEFFNALLDDRAFVVIPPHFHRLRITVGHKHPACISRHIKKQAPQCSFLLAYALSDYNEAALLVPTLKLGKKLCCLVIFVHPFPIFYSRRLPLYCPRQFSDDDVWQASFPKKTKHFLRKKSRVSAHATQLPRLRHRASASVRKLDTPLLAPVLPLRNQA